MTSNHPLNPALAGFLVAIGSERNGGFLNSNNLKRLASDNDLGGRLFLVLVRCGAGRFMCPAQDAPYFMDCVTKAGGFIRDVSILPEDIDRARARFNQVAATVGEKGRKSTPEERASVRTACHEISNFNEADCGGVFDGHQVISDADPGL